jgi:hypothetical protein
MKEVKENQYNNNINSLYFSLFDKCGIQLNTNSPDYESENLDYLLETLDNNELIIEIDILIEIIIKNKLNKSFN